MKQLLNQVEELWCHAMHKDVMWPVRGEYRCGVCLRSYPVPFAEPATPVSQGRFLLREAHMEN